MSQQQVANVIPSNSADQKNIQKALDEVVNAMIRMDSERSYVNESLKEISDQYGIEKKLLRQVAKTKKDDAYNEKTEEMNSFEELYETLYEKGE